MVIRVFYVYHFVEKQSECTDFTNIVWNRDVEWELKRIAIAIGYKTAGGAKTIARGKMDREGRDGGEGK